MNDPLAALNIITDAVLAFKKPESAKKRAAAVPGLTFYEFFAGGGMARAGLGPKWACRFANDFDFKKAATYKENWGDDALMTKDVRQVTVDDLPGSAALVWASFPCQDLSLAGMGAGLKGDGDIILDKPRGTIRLVA